MVTRRKMLRMIGELEARVAGQASEISGLRREVAALRKEIDGAKCNSAEPGGKAAEGQRKAMMGFGDFRASHPFRPDQGRKES